MSRFRFVVPVMLSLSAVAGPSAAFGQVAISVNVTIAPPPLPVYEQPAIPAPGYIWTPGYWAYGPDGYYWVPGTWVLPPAVGLLWTPGWWGWNNGVYVFNQGYWGPQVGFYGGINYGYGYGGVGYQGGYWNRGQFEYNRAANNIGSVHITNIYNRTIINNTTAHVSFNGGQGGIQVRPTAQQEAFAHQAHTQPTPLQIQHQQAAASNRDLLATTNHGRPPIAATPRPGAFTGPGIVPARPVGGPVTTGPRPGPVVTHPPGGAPVLRPPGQGGAPPIHPGPGPVRPGGPPPVHPVAPPVRPPVTQVPHPAPAPVRPQPVQPVRPQPVQPVRPAPMPQPRPQPAPPRPQAAPQRPAPQQQHEEKKPPG